MTDSEKALRGRPRHSRNFQGIKFRRLRLPVGQDSLDRPVHHLFFVHTKDGSFRFISQAEERPSRIVDFSPQAVSVKILNHSPARYIKLAFDLQSFRQFCAVPDEDSSGFNWVWHLTFLD